MYKRKEQWVEDDPIEGKQPETIKKFLGSKGRKRIGLTFGKQERKKRYVVEERHYEKLFINRVSIFLPSGLHPYSTQKLMMVKMLNALNNKTNVLIESPTGSGKTMALLSSSCAWLVQYKEEREKSKAKCPRHGVIKTDFSAVKKTEYDAMEKEPKMVSKVASKVKDEEDKLELMTSVADSTMITLDDSDDEVCTLSATKNKSAFDELNEEFQDDFKPIVSSFVNDNSNVSPDFHYQSEEEGEMSNCASNAASKLECTCPPRITIYYGTRTHKQIAQVIKEYSRLPFGVNGTLKHTILASRDHSCINPITRGKSDITAHCKELLSHEGIGCTFRNDIRKFDNNPYRLRGFVEENGGNRVWDMEDLVQSLSESRPAVCPYFAVTRTFTIDADVVFCPFNYLINPIIRKSSDVHLKNSVVILDEAHNVEDIARDAASFELQERELTFCIENLSEKGGLVFQKISELNGGKGKKSDLDQWENFERNELSPEELANVLTEFHECLNILLKFGQQLYKWLKDWAQETLQKCPQKPDGSFTLTYSFQQLMSSLTLNNLLLNNDDLKELKTAWLCVAGKEKSVLDEDAKSRTRSADAVQDQIPPSFRPAQAAYVAFEKFITFLQFFSLKENRVFYKCNVLIERTNNNSMNQFSATQQNMQKRGRFMGMRSQRPTQHHNDEWLDSRTAVKFEPIKPNYDISLNLWCMFPSVAFTDAFNECRSVILASGTLCPTETLKSELGLEFNSEMEGSQVISKERIFATVLSAGPCGTRLNATYKNISSGSDFMVELARVVVTTCLNVPKGILCFVSSYNVLNLLKECIDQQGLNIPLQARKVIFEEPRRSADLQSTLDSFELAIKQPKRYGPHCDGALMLAVFRGKVSEGIDFADDKARCVICVGIPYPNARNELVIQKKRFNDENAKSIKILTGDEWYTTQAYRALNQALGRCLRHRGDWGALVLVDERFEAKANPRCADSKKISRWVRDQLLIYSDFSKFEIALNTFVTSMTKLNEGEVDENFDNSDVKMEEKPIVTVV